MTPGRGVERKHGIHAGQVGKDRGEPSVPRTQNGGGIGLLEHRGPEARHVCQQTLAERRPSFSSRWGGGVSVGPNPKRIGKTPANGGAFNVGGHTESGGEWGGTAG